MGRSGQFSLLTSFLKNLFCWSVIDLQCCVNFCYKVIWLYVYICICMCIYMYMCVSQLVKNRPDPVLIPGSGRSAGERWRDRLPTPVFLGFPGGLDGKKSACNAGDWVWSLGQEDPLEEGMATHSSTVTWRIPWTEKPGGLQSMRSQRVGHDRTTNTSTFFHIHTHTHICI